MICQIFKIYFLTAVVSLHGVAANEVSKCSHYTPCGRGGSYYLLRYKCQLMADCCLWRRAASNPKRSLETLINVNPQECILYGHSEFRGLAAGVLHSVFTAANPLKSPAQRRHFRYRHPAYSQPVRLIGLPAIRCAAPPPDAGGPPAVPAPGRRECRAPPPATAPAAETAAAAPTAGSA